MESGMMQFDEFNDLIGLEEVRAGERRYAL